MFPTYRETAASVRTGGFLTYLKQISPFIKVE